MMGRIHSFQSMGAVDGPGLRYVVFMQGCPLRCPYCHNPDTWAVNGGHEWAPEQVFERILRVREYLSGGVTVSGGEPLLQPEFVTELFTLLKEENIHTALDTSGCSLPENMDTLLNVTDLVLLDLKMNTDARYREMIGIPLAAPVKWLDELERRGKPVWVRQVIVPGIHDRPGEMERLKGILAPYHCVEKVELLPFRKLCLEKYQKMGIDFPFAGMPEASGELIERLKGELKRIE